MHMFLRRRPTERAMTSVFSKPARGGVAALLLVWCVGCRTVDLRSPPQGTDQAVPVSVIPFEWRGNAPTVEVFVGSAGPYRFMVDTGTGHTIVSPACARAAGLETTSRAGMVGGSVGTTTREIEVTRIPQLRLGATSFSGVAGVVDDLSPFGIDGILGFRAFHDVLLTIDGPGRAIRLEKGRLPDPETDPLCLPLAPGEGAVPYVRGRIAGQPALFLIDSGFDGYLFLARNIPAAQGIDFEPDPDGGVQLRTRLSTHTAEAGHLRERVEIGSLVFENPPTILGMGGPVILGGALLRERVVTFDQRALRMRISARAP